ncbi:MAG: OsmC family protein [Desulfotignum sp.]|nr:OsmC family protein [Desulfotignum sp.]
MNTLNDFLAQKRLGLQARDEKFAKGELEPWPLHAEVNAEGRSGIRHIRIRQHHIINDSLHDFAGFDLGPNTPETMMGVIGACVVHLCQMHAALMKVPMDSIDVVVDSVYDPRAGRPGFEDVPVHPTDIVCQVNIASPASTETIQKLFEAADKSCPVLELVRRPQKIKSILNHTKTKPEA